MTARDGRAETLAAVLEDLRSAALTLVEHIDRDAGRDLVLAWRRQAPGDVKRDPAARVAAHLTTLCRTRAGAELVASSLPVRVADVAMVWAESASSRTDVVLAPLVAAKLATPALRVRAARERLLQGPLVDAVHCLPVVWGEHSTAKMRIRQLLWEAGARSLTLPLLGRWLWSTPEAVQALIVDPARGHLGERVLAARTVALLADGFTEDSAPALTRRVIDATRAMFEHSDAVVWAPAARALGRMALGSASARALVFRGGDSPKLSVRRRNAAAIASLPPALGMESWIEEQLDRLLGEDARRADPWQLAALAVATPHLARERPEIWDELCKIALAEPQLELSWSLSQGLAILGRQSAGQGWNASEERVVRALRKQLVAMAPESANDVARQLDAIVCVDRALGVEPTVKLCLDQFDERIRADIDGAVAPEPPLPRLVFDEEFEHVGSSNVARRGRAQAALRSATRAHAMHLPELVLGLRHLNADTEHMMTACHDRLASDVCGHGERTTIVGALTDLVSSYGVRKSGTGHGRASARALRAVAGSKWVREMAETGSEAQGNKARREIQRFRRPLENLFDTCLAHRPELAARDEDATVPPVVAAWWAVCAGPAAVLGPIERTPRDEADGNELAEAIAALEGTLREGATGTRVRDWGPRLLRTLDRLGASDTALADVLQRLVTALSDIEQARADAPADEKLQQLRALQACTSALVGLGDDLDDALAPRAMAPMFDERGATVRAPAQAQVQQNWPAGSAESPANDRVWTLLPPAVRPLIVPVVTRLVAETNKAPRFEAKEGAVLRDYVLVKRLGEGGMGEVWFAKRGRHPVALKIPRPGVPPQMRKLLAQSLRGEAATMEPMSVAKVAGFEAAGEIDDVPYLATTFVRGRTLETHLIDDAHSEPAGAQLPLVRRVMRDICIGLDNLHRHGIVHRDLKPSNVMLRMRGAIGDPLKELVDDPDGEEIDEAVLIDFGIAHEFHLASGRGATVGYAAPESLSEVPVGPAADVYSLGATLFHVLTKQRLCGERPVVMAIAWHMTTEPADDELVKTACDRLPPKLAMAILNACRLDPEARLSIRDFRGLLADPN